MCLLDFPSNYSKLEKLQSLPTRTCPHHDHSRLAICIGLEDIVLALVQRSQNLAESTIYDQLNHIRIYSFSSVIDPSVDES